MLYVVFFDLKNHGDILYCEIFPAHVKTVCLTDNLKIIVLVINRFIFSTPSFFCEPRVKDNMFTFTDAQQSAHRRIAFFKTLTN